MIDIAPVLLRRIEAAARARWPEECCGLLVGARSDHGFTVRDLIESPNRAVAPKRGFEIDAALHLRAQRRARAGGQAVIGVYHSHPTGSAAPSAADHDGAVESDWLWIICALGDKTAAPQWGAYRTTPSGNGTSPLDFKPLTLPTAC